MTEIICLGILRELLIPRILFTFQTPILLPLLIPLGLLIALHALFKPTFKPTFILTHLFTVQLIFLLFFSVIPFRKFPMLIPIALFIIYLTLLQVLIPSTFVYLKALLI